MPASTTSVFSEPDDFQAALHKEGNVSLLITAYGRFLARLTEVQLYCIRLAAVEEHLPRIGFLAVPPDMVLISFPIGDRPPPIWGGMRPTNGAIMTFGPDHRVHVRTHGPSRWGAIWLPADALTEHFHKLTENALTIPAAAQWRPPYAAGRRLLRLHAAAIRAAEVRPETIVDAEAAHGMEQQLIDVLVECLSAVGTSDEKIQTRGRNQGVAMRFEALLQTNHDRSLGAEELADALGMSARLLRTCCAENLGMSPTSYIRLRAMHSVHDVLRGRVPGQASVSLVASSRGFRDLGRFAATYRSLFGELPSATLRRNSRRQMAHIAPARRRLLA
jgi:AraC-like DNA-binding protein